LLQQRLDNRLLKLHISKAAEHHLFPQDGLQN